MLAGGTVLLSIWSNFLTASQTILPSFSIHVALVLVAATLVSFYEGKRTGANVYLLLPGLAALGPVVLAAVLRRTDVHAYSLGLGGPLGLASPEWIALSIGMASCYPFARSEGQSQELFAFGLVAVFFSLPILFSINVLLPASPGTVTETLLPAFVMSSVSMWVGLLLYDIGASVGDGATRTNRYGKPIGVLVVLYVALLLVLISDVGLALTEGFGQLLLVGIVVSPLFPLAVRSGGVG